MQSVQRVPATIDRADFIERFVAPGVPVILEGAALQWPARNWSPQELAKRYGQREVTISRSVEESEPSRKERMPLRDFVAEVATWRHLDAARSAAVAPGQKTSFVEQNDSDDEGVGEEEEVGEAHGEEESAALLRGSGAGNVAAFLRRHPRRSAAELTGPPLLGSRPGYLKQLDLSEFPSLHDDISPVFDLFADGTVLYTAYLWMGPAGAETGLHSDDEENFLACLYGEKQVILYAPELRHRLYVNSKYDSGTECCDAHPLRHDAERHPLFRPDDGLVANLRPGDVLYMPIFWYHYVRTITTSITVNVFGSTLKACLQQGLKRWFLQGLHAAGFYGNEWCVCHQDKQSSAGRCSHGHKGRAKRDTVLV